MAKRGDAAREAVKNKIIEAFGSDFVAFLDKKIYVEAQDGPGGETLQFAITMTMPKTSVARQEGASDLPPATGDWTGPAAATPVVTPTEITADDKAKVAELMKKLGLE